MVKITTRSCIHILKIGSGFNISHHDIVVYGTKLDAARCDVLLCRRGASRRHIYPLPPLDVVCYEHRHGKVATEIPHFNPRIGGVASAAD